MQTLEHDTNCAEIMMNPYTHSISYLLPLSQNVFKLLRYNCTRRRVPLVKCRCREIEHTRGDTFVRNGSSGDECVHFTLK